MAAHSFIWIGDEGFFAYRESYATEFAALFRDDELVADLDAPVYQLNAALLRDRLDVLGFTASHAQERLDLLFAEVDDGGLESFPDWLTTMHAALNGDGAVDEVPAWTVHGDIRLPLRLMLDAAPDDMPVSLDLSDVVARGYVSATPDLCARAFSEHHGAAAYAPLIVLTEGRSDAAILMLGIDVLSPHLRGYIRFLDYERKPEGSTSALVRVVRAFAAAGVSNRVLALFDNDTAAAEALTTLGVDALPPNYRVVQLPHLQLAEQYPTLGPTGPVVMDINGLAVSIELFFGADILRGSGPDLTPVQWTGWSAKIGRYQGEILHKSSLQEAFRERARRTLASGGPDEADDWSGMRLVIDTLRTSFA
ncbi:MAG TPA: hypothetical protein VGX28_08805 [Frankiaceae bacterium]|nr:hypothetical protein [Frankiaceae bacterium]